MNKTSSQIIDSIIGSYMDKCVSNNEFTTSTARDSFVQDIFSFCEKHEIDIDSKMMKSLAEKIHDVLPNEREVYH